VFYLLRAASPRAEDGHGLAAEGPGGDELASDRGAAADLRRFAAASKYAASGRRSSDSLIFLIRTVVAMCAAPQRKGLRRWCDVLTNTSEQVFPLLATVISVGVLVNIMTATGSAASSR
jgi:CitMHS family citrate-Mg2+:H+ or citrate-Ca2+:H+ symporter